MEEKNKVKRQRNFKQRRKGSNPLMTKCDKTINFVVKGPSSLLVPGSHAVEISQLGRTMVSEIRSMINKCEANSFGFIYRILIAC